ncbi:hypothetical protein AB6E53_02475 [Vibrio breoganii]|uniref:hypothetical protein n=1 Tax=Vibrio breoganii TaxID=553239 RepID=UPI0012FFED80|nr:hypothetical protein [Vibrio breoganii]
MQHYNQRPETRPVFKEADYALRHKPSPQEHAKAEARKRVEMLKERQELEQQFDYL